MRHLPLLAIALVVVGCQTPERVVVRPLPDDSVSLSFVDLVARARTLANQASEQFFVDAWADLEPTARALEQTARLLKRSPAPAERQSNTVALAERLERDSKELVGVAQSRSVEGATAVLQRINVAVRSFNK